MTFAHEATGENFLAFLRAIVHVSMSVLRNIF